MAVKTLTQALKESGLVTDDEHKKLLLKQAETRNQTFFTAVMLSNILDEETFINFAANFFGMARVKDAFTVQVDFPTTFKVVGDIFEVIKTRVFAVLQDGKIYFVLNDPENEFIRKKIMSALGREPEYMLLSSKEYSVIDQYQITPKSIVTQSEKVKKKGNGEVSAISSTEQSEAQKLLDMLIAAAMDRRASDLHLLPRGDGSARVMLRVDGVLLKYGDIVSDSLTNLRNILKTMGEVGDESPDAPVETQISQIYKGANVDIRVNIVRSALGYDFNLRFITNSIKNLEEIGLSEENYRKFVDLLHMTKGLVILCGPTGSGKTSLLYAGFRRLLDEDKAIFTVEDPVEIVLPGTTQLEVNRSKKDMSYEKRFPSSLRHDPDVIGIGETRTIEVAEQVVQAANTGHLVFTTLHTNDAVGAVSRLTNIGLDSYTVGDVLAAVVAQRLIRRVCTECAQEYELPMDHEWRKKYDLGDGKVVLKKGRGCSHCSGTGYFSRIAVNEFLIATPEVRGAIQKGATRFELETILMSQPGGYRTYIADAVDKARCGISTFEEVDKLYADVV